MPALADFRRAYGNELQLRSGTLRGDLRRMRTEALAPEKQTVLAALRNADGNVSDAAVALGASRRTLQNRMRFYAIPPGKSGRPREALPYKAPLIAGLSASELVTAAGIGAGAFFLGRYLARRFPISVGEGAENRYLVGARALAG